MQRLLAALWIASWLAAPGSAATADDLEVLARVGPWPVAANLIGYRGRLWFSNAVRYENHNSADLWSLDPAGGPPRFERRLFSQDAGVPLVHDGLLWWPYEDARFSVGFGHVAVTDGRAWRHGVIPSAQSFHTHALAATGGALVAATSAWRAGLQRSDDRGRTWRSIYDHPTPDGRVTRIVELVPWDGLLFARLTRAAHGLLVVEGDRVAPAPGWPMGRPVRAIAVGDMGVVGLVDEGTGFALWRTDGKDSSRVGGLPAGNPRDLAVTRGRPHVLMAERTGGAILERHGNGRWSRRHVLQGGRPDELAVIDGRLFAAGAGDDGRGIVWGRPGGIAGDGQNAAGNLPDFVPDRSRTNWAAAGEALDRLLADPASYGRGRPILRDRILALARAGPPPGFFAERLIAERPEERLSLIGGNVTIDAAGYARWLLLFGMTVAGEGRVPPDLLRLPFTERRNPAEKYFSTLPAAVASTVVLGQDDPATIDALITRLEAATGEPAWLRRDLVTALAALTGRPPEDEPRAWRRWWEGMRE